MTLVTPPSGPDFDVTDYEALAYYRREPGYVVHDGVSGPASPAPTLPPWAASTSYKAGQEIWVSAGTVAVAQSTHLSGSTYAADKAAGKWVEVAGGGTSGAGRTAATDAYAATVTPTLPTTAGMDLVENVGTLTGNLTLANPTGTAPADGQLIRFRLVQDATGSRTVAFGTSYAFGTDVPANLSPLAANAKWEMTFEWNATDSKWRCIGIVRGF